MPDEFLNFGLATTQAENKNLCESVTNTAPLPRKTPSRSFSFILNRIDVKFNSPTELIPGYFLQKADTTQIQLIKEKLRCVNSMRPPTSLYECVIVQEDVTEPDDKHYRYDNLPSDQWNYWVIVTDLPSKEWEELNLSVGLLRHDLYLGFTFDLLEGFFEVLRPSTRLVQDVTPGAENIINHATGGLVSPPDLYGIKSHRGFNFQFFENDTHFEESAVNMGTDEKTEIFENYTLLKIAKEVWPAYYKAAERFQYLRALPFDSELTIIGYFSVIESLITHNPKLTANMDSLTHQMKTKMNLLSKKVQRPLDYQSFFGIADGDKVWGNLYNYRSKIAHGDEPDFKSELKLLRNHHNAIAFLRETTKLLILQALKEPQFTYDLKKC